MRWLFVGKFSERMGKDYIYKCDNCGHTIKVEDIFPNEDRPRTSHIPTKRLGRIVNFWCPVCGEFEKW